MRLRSLPPPACVSLLRVLLLLGLLPTAGLAAPRTAAPAAWPPAVAAALGRAGANRAELLHALRAAPPAQRPGLEFLIANMPGPDLHTLRAAYLLRDAALAYGALQHAPWRAAVPPDVFLNDVLPYACLNEARDGSRGMLRARMLPLCAGAATPGEAAQALNAKLFPLFGVRYSTARHRADQAPTETIASGKATCSGLSILLVDACRAVGVPARVAGTPLWSDRSGNHTWVEVWDGGWHFVGAAEPDAKGLDHAWFQHNASLARRDVPANAIYASSFARTGLAFPLVWAPQIAWVPAVNVTDRYAPPAAAVDPTVTRLLVGVLDPEGRRVPAHLLVRDIADGARTWAGLSRGETADMRDRAAFTVPRGRAYEVTATRGGVTVRQPFAPGDAPQATAMLQFGHAPAPEGLSPPDAARVTAAARAFFAATPDRQAAWQFPAGLDALLLRREAAVRRAVWLAYRAAPIHEALQKDFDAHQVTFDTHLSPYTLKTVGTRPAGGWPLVIAMHGGGNAPKELNDSQWKIMQVYYKDHAEKGGYKYLALRAPNDTWNGFYDVYVYPLVANLVTQFRLFGNVDPNKVFLMGYSHGGYGAFAIGPKEPDLFAAIHAAAAAPTDGETTAKTLRSTEFTAMVGGNDDAFGRLGRDRKFASGVDALRADRHDAYPLCVQVMPGYDHPNLPDRDKIFDLYPAVRDPAPRAVSWLMTDDVIHDLFWLHADAPAKAREVDAACRDNCVTVTTTGGDCAGTVLLDGRLVDFARPVTLTVNGVTTVRVVRPSLRVLCATMARRADPDLAFTAALPLAH